MKTSVSVTPVPRDVLWDSTLHQCLIINWDGEQGELRAVGAETPVACGGLGHSLGPVRTQKRGGSLKDFVAKGSVPGMGVRESSFQS